MDVVITSTPNTQSNSGTSEVEFDITTHMRSKLHVYGLSGTGVTDISGYTWDDATYYTDNFNVFVDYYDYQAAEDLDGFTATAFPVLSWP